MIAPFPDQAVETPRSKRSRQHRQGSGRIVASAIAIALSLLAVGCSSDESTTEAATKQDSASETTKTSAEATSEPDTKVVAPEAVGPYKVGRRTISMNDTARGRVLDVDIWYPVNQETTGTPTRYSFLASMLPTLFFDSTVALDSPPIQPGEQFPMVVYSHGSGGFRWVAAYFTEVLASHGFVVVAADHGGNTAVDGFLKTQTARDQTAVNRVGDVRFVVDQMLAMNAEDGGPFLGSIDEEKIGISGHSFGGFTAIAARTGFSNSLGTVPPDPRIKAVALMAPATELLDEDRLKALDVPTLTITGTKDITTSIDDNVERLWELGMARPFYRIDLQDAAHQTFTDVCFYQQELPKIEAVPQALTDLVAEKATEACAPGLLDVPKGQAIANTFIVSFFETELAGTTDYETVLTAEGASAIPEAKFSIKEK